MMLGRRAVLASGLSGAAAALGLSGGGVEAIAAPSPTVGRFVEVDGVRLHYRIAGSGPAVVLLHGWPETSHAWLGVMERLKDRFTLIAPDLRGTGLSDKPETGYDKRTIARDISGLIEHVAGGQAAVVGHDMGGKAAYMLALLSPERVSRLVLVDCLVPGTENMDAARGGAWHYGFHMARDIPEMLTRGRERDYIAAQIRTWSHVKGAVDEAAIDEYAARYSAPGGMTAGFNLYRALPEDIALAATLGGQRFAMPVMTVAGAKSARRLLADAIERQAPGHEAVVIPDCGHFVAAEAPDVLAGHLARFLST